MIKKILYVTLILCLILAVSNITYATDILMDLNNNTNSADTSNQTVDNTIYSDVQENSNVSEPIIEYESETSTTTDYEDPGELSITNMINIILIVVGVVLILLGIAIIIKLK